MNQDAKKKALQKIGEGFTLGWLREEVRRRPNNVDALAELANLLTRAGQYQAGLEADLKLAVLRPTDPVVHYNLCCSYALMNRKDEALRSLERAIELGYQDREFLLNDRDLSDLREDSRFLKLVEQIEKNAGGV